MEITPGRAMYSPDEELKPLRQPKTYHPESAAGNSTLSINAAEFVPRFSISTNNVQERLQKHQRQYLQQNYQQYQQPHQQMQQQQQYQEHQQQQHHQSYSNGYDNQQQQLQQYQQSSQNINALMGSINISSVQDRLRTGINSGSRGGEVGGYFCQQQQRGNVGSQPDYQQNNHYRFNKNHNNHQQQHQPHQHQHHHHQHQNRYNNEQQEQQQQFHQQNQQETSNASALAESANDMDNVALDYLQTVIHCLNQNPGQFDIIATRFNYIFEGMETNHFVLSNSMEDIFDESIRNPNFRYMGAKLYSLLHTLNPSKDSLFHTMLKYKLDFHQQQVRGYIEKKQEAKVRETALFLAELYMQLRGEDSRNNLIAENIVFSLKELLSLEDNKDNLRCICLTLKLAGYDLSIDCPNDMTDIITKLDAINFQNPGKYPLANNVIALQKNNWGRKTTGSVTQAETHTPQKIQTLRTSDDPVFYGPDGREITAEECEFLTNGADYLANSSDNEEDNDDVDLDPEMDEETERDFKLFLKQANNKS